LKIYVEENAATERTRWNRVHDPTSCALIEASSCSFQGMDSGISGTVGLDEENFIAINPLFLGGVI
jgi:hypothetical protein